jgi:hypothetical protein
LEYISIATVTIVWSVLGVLRYFLARIIIEECRSEVKFEPTSSAPEEAGYGLYRGSSNTTCVITSMTVETSNMAGGGHIKLEVSSKCPLWSF